MARSRTAYLFATLAAIATGCEQGQRNTPAATESSATAPATPERLESDDPRAGMNNTRPDSIEDVKPEPGTPSPTP